jgi:ABC-type transport system involved in cytochrome bd biosynthesis fused ATPase/permease subunit
MDENNMYTVEEQEKRYEEYNRQVRERNRRKQKFATIALTMLLIAPLAAISSLVIAFAAPDIMLMTGKITGCICLFCLVAFWAFDCLSKN